LFLDLIGHYVPLQEILGMPLSAYNVILDKIKRKKEKEAQTLEKEKKKRQRVHIPERRTFI